MDKFNKITVGFVVQSFEKNNKGNFVCVSQGFITGDQVDYENEEGNSIEKPDYKYQAFNMTL